MLVCVCFCVGVGGFGCGFVQIGTICRGGGIDFSLGERVSETMTWRDGPN